MFEINEVLKKIIYFQNRINYLKELLVLEKTDIFNVRELTSQIEACEKTLENLRSSISISDLNIVNTNGFIDLCLFEDKENYFKFLILLTDTLEIVGNIEYRTAYGDPIRYNGNIGYQIYSSYRGNRYVLTALNMLKDFLLDKQIDNVIIVVSKDNIPSIKIIERFGGVLQPSECDELLVYKCTFFNKDKNLTDLKKLN